MTREDKFAHFTQKYGANISKAALLDIEGLVDAENGTMIWEKSADISGFYEWRDKKSGIKLFCLPVKLKGKDLHEIYWYCPQIMDSFRNFKKQTSDNVLGECLEAILDNVVSKIEREKSRNRCWIKGGHNERTWIDAETGLYAYIRFFHVGRRDNRTDEPEFWDKAYVHLTNGGEVFSFTTEKGQSSTDFVAETQEAALDFIRKRAEMILKVFTI